MTEPLVRRAIALHAVLVVVLTVVGNAYGFTQEYLDAHGAWVPLLVVNAGILAGNLLMAMLGGSDETARVVAQGRREDLEHGRAVVVEQLRGLEAERDKLTPEDYATERARLVMIGAGALRELEQVAEAHPELAAPPMAPGNDLSAQLRALRESDPAAFDEALGRIGVTPRGGMSGEWRGAAYTLGIVVLVALLVNYASNDAKERGPNGTMTGGDSVQPMQPPAGAPEGAAQAAPPADPRIAELEARVAANPKDVTALNDLTEMYLAGQDLNGAMSANSRAIEAAPEDVDAHVFRAVLRAFIGRRDQAILDLDEVLKAHPDQLRALVYTGLLSMNTDPAKAVAALEKAVAQDDSAQLQAALAEAKRRLAGGPVAAPSAPPAGGPPPGAPAAAGAVLASGTIELGSPATSGKVLFVSVQGATGGPPFAALKLAPGPFPMKFEITSANIIPMMAGRPLPAQFSVVARLDSDGDAMTRPETDPSARQDAVSAGASNLVLKLP